MIKTLKITSIVLGGTISMLITLLILISTGVLNQRIAGIISGIANKQLEGHLTIEKIGGNIFSHFYIHNLNIEQSNINVVCIDELEIKYNIWGILEKRIETDTLIIHGLNTIAIEGPDGVWNLENLLADNKTPAKDSVSSSFSWEIVLNNILINEFQASLQAIDTASLIPRIVKFNASLDLAIAYHMMTVDLHHYEMRTREPALYLANLNFNAILSDSVLTWNDLYLELNHSKIHSNGYIPLHSPSNAELMMNAVPLDFTDLNEWLPGLYGNLVINMQVSSTDNNSNIELNLKSGAQSVDLLGTLANLNSIPAYQVSLETDSLNIEYWTHEPKYQSNINGKFELSGLGFNFRENTISARAQFDDLNYENYDLVDFLLSFEKTRDNLTGNVQANTIFGDVSSRIHVDKLFESPVYDAELKMKQFNLAKITLNKILESDINLELLAKGQGIVPGKMLVDLQVKSQNSVLFDQPVTDFDARLALYEEEYSIRNLIFETPYVSARISGKGHLVDKNQLNFSLKAINIYPIGSLLKIPPMHFQGEINGDLSGPADALEFTSQLIINEFKIDSVVLKNTQASITSIISFSNALSGVDSYSNINYIPGITLKNLDVKTDVQSEYAAYGQYYLEDINLYFEKTKELIEGRIAAISLLGNMETQFHIGHVFSDPDYTLTSSLKHIDLAKITNNDTLNSDINLEITAQGKGIEPDSMNLEIEFRSNDSYVFGWPMVDLDASIKFDRGDYLLDRFCLETPFVLASLTGEGNWITDNHINFDLITKDVKIIAPVFRQLNMELEGEISGQLKGVPDSLCLLTDIKIEHLLTDEFQIDRIDAQASLNLSGSSYSGHINTQLGRANIKDLEIKMAQFASNFNQDKARNSFSFYISDSLNGTILSEVLFSNNPIVYLPEIALNIQNKLWEGGSSSSFIRFGPDSIEFNNIGIISNGSAVNANGIFAFRGTENLQIDITNIELRNIPGFQSVPYPVSGLFNSQVNLTGTAEKPIITGGINILEPEFDTLRFEIFHLAFYYSNENLRLDSYLDNFSSRLLSADMDLPIYLSFTDNFYLPDANNPLNANITVYPLNINRFNSLIPLKGAEADGLLSANISIGNTISNPLVSGKINLINGVFNYNKLGVHYNNIGLYSQLNNNQVNLDSLHIYSGKGSLQMQGSLEMDSLFNAELKYIDLNLTGHNFKAFDSELARAVINTNLNLNGTAENPVFSGNLTIPRATFNIDQIMKEFNRVYDNSELPMLVMAQNKTGSISFYPVNEKDTIRKPPIDYYKNLTGIFDIVIPRNTWIKGKNMNFELAGAIKAVKTAAQVDFFGSMNVKRGYYLIYGRHLNFEQGEVTLTGGRSLNPLIDFKVAYKFRDPDNLLRKLNVHLTGRLSKPDLKFFIDEAAIDEKEAISYLLFNKSSNQLDTRQNNAVLNTNLDLAMGQVSKEIQALMQSRLGLDVIEISGKSGWSQSTVTTGKYITNNLFVNYEHTFALDKKDKVIEPEKITLEYQFYRQLYLQAINQSPNSGFDFILKWTWK